MAFPSKITQQPQTASDSLSKTFLMSCLGGWGGGGVFSTIFRPLLVFLEFCVHFLISQTLFAVTFPSPPSLTVSHA